MFTLLCRKGASVEIAQIASRHKECIESRAAEELAQQRVSAATPALQARANQQCGVAIKPLVNARVLAAKHVLRVATFGHLTREDASHAGVHCICLPGLDPVAVLRIMRAQVRMQACHAAAVAHTHQRSCGVCADAKARTPTQSQIDPSTARETATQPGRREPGWVHEQGDVAVSGYGGDRGAVRARCSLEGAAAEPRDLERCSQ